MDLAIRLMGCFRCGAGIAQKWKQWQSKVILMWKGRPTVDVNTLLRHIARLPADTPLLAATLEADVTKSGVRTVWYKTQKEHLQGWLREYSGPGAYGRKGGFGRDAEFFYNHFQCAPGLFWLAEAAGVPKDLLMAAVTAVEAAGPNYARQCGALRRKIPWSEVEAKLQARR